MSKYTKEQVDEIREGAGKRRQLYFRWRFPFIYRANLVFGGHCGLCGKWNWQWCDEGWEWTGPCKECIKSCLAFIEVELAHGIVNDSFLEFERGKEKVERARPSRWYNPALIAIDKELYRDFEHTGESEIDQFGEIEKFVVAVPDSDWGYGTKYKGVVKENRLRLGLK